MLSCLTKKFSEGAAYGTSNTMRSAIAFISLEELSDSNLLKRFFKGGFKLKPPAPRYDSIWDPGIMLELIKSWGPTKELDLRRLTFKVTMFLALYSAFRIQSLSLIKLNNIKCLISGIEIRITSLIKTFRPGAKQPYAFFHFFTIKIFVA